MGVNQSSQSSGVTRLATSHGITVVNPSPEQPAPEENIVLPPRASPILSIEGHVLDPKKHPAEVQLNHQLWIDFITTIDRYSNSRADLVASRQTHLQGKIILTDQLVQKFTDSYINDKHKALARMNEDCRRAEEIQKLLEKCTIQTELCLDMLDKLNFLLPDEHKLEPIEV